jgi:hypothetical protein
VLILRLLRHRWSLPLVGEEKDDGCSEGTLSAPLWVALLSVSSRSGSMRNGMICLGSSSPSRSDLTPYISRWVRYMAV